jgi:hydroxyethylthiazole kinase-like uncharacterized protein yjeF
VSGRPILTAAQMRAAEAQVVAAGTSVEALMERAGRAAAEAIARYAGRLPTLVLCGPGNNGGDGYVIARALRARGADVRVAATGEPTTPAAQAARRAWEGPVETIGEARAAPLVVDALFGTGLKRSLDTSLSEWLCSLTGEARITVAIDVPSGVSSDDGRLLSPVPHCDLCVTFGALKPAHLLYPAAVRMGRIVVADIGVPVSSNLHEIARPAIPAPGPEDHKYSRGYVAVQAGVMPGAAALAAGAAMHAGAGYVRLVGGSGLARVPSAVVQSPEGLDDPRIGAIAIGPGLGSDRALLDAAMALEKPLVLDADALTLLGPSPHLRHLPHTAILTPHAGEFARLFETAGSKLDQTRRAAASSGAVIVYKGADTVIAAPDGRAAIAPPASHWLASAGTGDVLTGIVAAMRARGLGAFEAACAAVWLHARAAELGGPGLIADDLLPHLPQALAECA